MMEPMVYGDHFLIKFTIISNKLPLNTPLLYNGNDNITI